MAKELISQRLQRYYLDAERLDSGAKDTHLADKHLLLVLLIAEVGLPVGH
jgi:hypothetical protein